MPASIARSESMLRMACICMPALALQVLVRGRPEWDGLPVAVVDRDAASGGVLWVNRAARDAGMQVVGVYDEFFHVSWPEMCQVCHRVIRSFE